MTPALAAQAKNTKTATEKRSKEKKIYFRTKPSNKSLLSGETSKVTDIFSLLSMVEASTNFLGYVNK